MATRRAARSVGGALCAAMTLASCGLVDNISARDDAPALQATVAVLVPGGTSSGDGVRAAVEAAIQETATDIEGWSVDVELVDTGMDHDGGGAAGLDELAGQIVDNDVVAVIGGLSTDTIRVVQPVFDAASLLFVSPADTVPEHTRGANPGAPIRPYGTYYRTAVGGESRWHALARYAAGALGASKVAVIDADDAPRSRDEVDDEVDAFSAAMKGLGADVVRVGNGDGSAAAMTEDDVARLLSEARDEDAEAVFVAGRSDVAAWTANQLASMDAGLELLGGSVLTSEGFLAEAGSSADGAWTAVTGDLAPTSGVADESLEAKLAERGATTGPYGAAAYDAGIAVGTVLSGCLPPARSARSAREGCTGEMTEVKFDGVTGEVAFDAFGDRVGAGPTIMTVRGGTVQPAHP